MGRTCEKRLFDESLCGLPTRSDREAFCEFHGLDVIVQGHKHYFPRYVEACKHKDLIDLSNLRIKEFVFDEYIGALLSSGNKPINFNGTEFTECRFDHVLLEVDIHFSESVFHNVVFQRCEFCGKRVLFDSAHFHGVEPPFHCCTFDCNDSVSFEEVGFLMNEMPFAECYISTNTLRLNGCRVDAGHLYIRAWSDPEQVHDTRYLSLLVNQCDFTGLRFEGDFEFCGGITMATPSSLQFQLLNFSQMRTATFLNADLRKARFTYSLLDKVRFVNCLWNQEEPVARIYDDVVRPEEVSEEEVRRQYSQLKSNFDKNHDFDRAGEWHYREVGSRKRIALDKADGERFSALRKTAIHSIYFLYKLISGYGESYLRPLAWLGVVSFSFAVLYFYNGYNLFGMHVDWELGWQSSWAGFRYFSLSVFYSLIAAFLILGKATGQLPSDSPWISAFHLSIVSTLLLFFILAVRRKFKR